MEREDFGRCAAQDPADNSRVLLQGGRNAEAHVHEILFGWEMA